MFIDPYRQREIDIPRGGLVYLGFSVISYANRNYVSLFFSTAAVFGAITIFYSNVKSKMILAQLLNAAFCVYVFAIFSYNGLYLISLIGVMALAFNFRLRDAQRDTRD